MSYNELSKQIENFDTVLKSLGMSLVDGSPVKRDFDTTREFLADWQTMPEAQWLPKWEPRANEFHPAHIVVRRLADAVVTLRSQKRLKSRLKTVLGQPLTQDFVRNEGKDIFYELEMAALWSECGFEVELAEPDVVVYGNGLSAPLGVACKYPSSWDTINDHISKGYRQITRHNYDGLVCLGIDQLALKDIGRFIDFRQNPKHPLAIMEDATNEVMLNLLNQRAADYPSERPIDGAMITLFAMGLYGNPVGLASVRHATLQTAHDNPRNSDFHVLFEKMQKRAFSSETRAHTAGA